VSHVLVQLVDVVSVGRMNSSVFKVLYTTTDNRIAA